MLGVGLLVGTASVASAASYYTFYQSPSGGVAPSTWKSKAVPGQAKYNGARVSTYDSGSAYAYVYVPEVGTASAPGTVVTSFAYQGGTFKCKWTWIGHTGKGPLTCKLKYG